MGTLIVHPKNKEQLSVLKAFMKALKISFEESKGDYSVNELESVSDQNQVKESNAVYNSKFVEKIKLSDEEFKSGKHTSIKTEDLWK
ncbi:DUF2683 family protein [Pedobacter foliorum]|uniref:DUF2683 family protein n=1 Tax=Pedobacter foliorum TaxID=2739058 RepID=UPI001563CE4B|nr:DUF2683 family protein [Pedobacter foliorum]NRF41771.1 hypothetical protein [Pedobacter foliorum]